MRLLFILFWISWINISQLIYVKSRDISLSPPTITEHPLNMTVSRNDPVTLTCKASGPGTLTYTWYRNGQKVLIASKDLETHRILLPGGSLFFLKAVHNKKEQDGGVYFCEVKNDFGTARTKNATLDIAYIRDDFRALPRDTDASIGEEITLKCLPPKGHPPPLIRWKKDANFLDLTSSNRIRIDDSGSLVIQNARKRDNGRYQCSARNIAGTRDSRPVRLKIHEPPYFINRPSESVALAGDDVLLSCQAGGDPYPDVQWHRRGTDIDIHKVKIVSGKGLRLENVHPSDEGVYICEATNIRGSISASAKLSIVEIPVITVKPPASLRKPARLETISLDCFVTGTPHPLVFWTIENQNTDDEVLLLPDSLDEEDKRISMNRDGSLLIQHPDVKDTGHYVCSSLNSVGSALSRSHLTVYEGKDNGSAISTEPSRIDEARLALLEKMFAELTADSESPTSIQMDWKLSPNPLYISDIRLYYRRKGDKTFTSRFLPRTRDTSYSLQGLEEFTEYEIFLRPYYKSVSGRSSQLLSLMTRPSAPSMAPKIVKIRILNATAIFIAWDYVDREHHNGNIKGYQLHIQDNHTDILTASLPSERLEAVIHVPKLLSVRRANVSLALMNHVGVGPFSAPEEIQVPSYSEFDMAVYTHRESGDSHAWLIVLIGSFTFMLAFLGGLTLYYRRRRRVLSKTNVYSTPGGSGGSFIQTGPQIPGSQPLWIDRRWNGTDYEKDSNSSEKKLLNGSTNGTPSQQYQENEYAYIDRNKLFSTFGNNRSCNNYESPAYLQSPYATTDILRSAAAQQKQGHSTGPRLFPLSVTPMLHPRSHFLSRSNTATSTCLFSSNGGGDGRKSHYYSSKVISRDARSCDDLTERLSGYARTHHHVYPSSVGPGGEPLEAPPRVQLYDPYPPRFSSRPFPPPPPPQSSSALISNRSIATEEAVTRFDDAVESYMSQGMVIRGGGDSETDSYLSHGGGESISEGSALSEDAAGKSSS